MWTAKLQALKSFNGFLEGDVFEVQLTEYWAHLIADNYVRMVERWLNTPSDFITSRSESSPSKPAGD